MEPRFLDYEEPKVVSEVEEKSEDSMVDAREISLHFLYHNAMSDSTLENYKALQEELEHRINTEKMFTQVFGKEIMSAWKAKETPVPKTKEDFN